jgi:predicted CXXCH cytochrome family protein
MAVARSGFLDSILGFGFVSTALSIVYPVWRYLIPPASLEPTTDTVVAGKVTDFPANSGAVIEFGAKPAIVVRAPDGLFRAFTAVCTDLDCTVQYKKEASQIWCACHNGLCDLSDHVVSGPPPRPLPRNRRRPVRVNPVTAITRPPRWPRPPVTLRRQMCTADKAAARARATGFRGKPSGQVVVTTCARCHSNAEFMRKYAPRQRVDQATEYASSVHGQQLSKGDLKVATCVSCHGAHGMRLVSDARSPVYPLNVVTTCTRCHADAERMRGYTLPDGSLLPTSQKADYERSVHYAAMTARNDLSAPTCNDCYLNHGAAPPGVGAVTNVCGTCHAVFATKFALSTHSRIFERGFVECHSNHAISEPSDSLLGTDKTALCSTCHGAGDNGFQAAGAMRARIEQLKAAIAHSAQQVASVENRGMEMGDHTLALREAFNHLTLARAEVHTFTRELVEQIPDEGLAITAKVDGAAAEVRDEFRFRQTGLATSLAAILLVVVALGWKVRTLDRQV